MANLIEFARGDGAYHTFSIPADAWVAGGKLSFAAKPAIDDDSTDAAAAIICSWEDDVVTDVTINGIAYKQYDCYFPPSATDSIVSDGNDSIDYLAEFQFVPPSGIPVTFPPNDPKLDARVYFDVRRGVV